MNIHSARRAAPSASSAPSALVVLAACFALFVTGCPNGAGITCPAGQSLCNGVCINVAADTHNCGACGTVCPATLACINGGCGCPSGVTRCGNVCVDTVNDPNNCGGCGNVCASDGNHYCIGGSCTYVFYCPPPLASCSGNTACVDTNNDSANCGACGNACPQYTICCGGACVSPLSTQHCGSCAPCPAGNICFIYMGTSFMCTPG